MNLSPRAKQLISEVLSTYWAGGTTTEGAARHSAALHALRSYVWELERDLAYAKAAQDGAA